MSGMLEADGLFSKPSNKDRKPETFSTPFCAKLKRSLKIFCLRLDSRASILSLALRSAGVSTFSCLDFLDFLDFLDLSFLDFFLFFFLSADDEEDEEELC